MKCRWFAAMFCYGLLFTASAVHAAPPALVLSHFSMTARADLGQAAFSYHIIPANASADVGMQIFVRRDDVTSRAQWDSFVPKNADGSTRILHLVQGKDTFGTFVLSLPKGVYGAYRVLLFYSPDGRSYDFNHVLYDTNNDPPRSHLSFHLTIKAEQQRVTAPILALPAHITDVTEGGNGTYTVTIPVAVNIPQGANIQGGGFWVMAKSPAGFSQMWAAQSKAESGGDANDPYQRIPVTLTLNNVRAGLWNVQFGLFAASFGNPLQWVTPGMDFEAGGDAWEKKAPVANIPPRLRVRNRRFVTLAGKPYDFYAGNPNGRRAVSFVRGGNYGNAIAWTTTPALNSPDYFERLKAFGCRFLRFNFNPDRYPDDVIYQHAVDQIVQNMWAAGLYPIICPQDLPQAGTIDARIEKEVRVARTMAEKYKGKSVWLEVCNEPSALGTWAAWKPVAVRCVKAIRAIDPEAFVIVPFEGWSKDGRSAAKDPITSVAVDLYDGHAYIDPAQVRAFYGPDVAAGLPTLIGEYGGGADYLTKMNAALESLPGLMGVAPWAFTIPGQDSLPLVADGSSNPLRLTPSGQAIATAYKAWDAGKRERP